MENIKDKITRIVQANDREGVLQMLTAGLDPNFEGGWPLRLAARNGSYAVVKELLHWGANPHLPGKAGASTLQLAVYCGLHWEKGLWELLLSCCDSSQLADGAAIAIVFNRLGALRQILKTGRCNTNVPTTLTGRTVDSLARGYNLEYILKEAPTATATRATVRQTVQCMSPALLHSQMRNGSEGNSSENSRSLSPSVAQFFEQTAHQASLSPRHAASPALRTHASPLLFTSPGATTLQ